MVWRRKRQQSAIKPALASAADRALIERGAQ